MALRRFLATPFLPAVIRAQLTKQPLLNVCYIINHVWNLKLDLEKTHSYESKLCSQTQFCHLKGLL